VSDAADVPVPAASVLYRPDALVLEALLSAVAQRGRRLFLFVNGPIEATIERLIRALPNAHIERSAENVGLGAGLNAVAASAERESFSHLVLFDQDSAPDENLCEALTRRFEALDRAPRPLAALGARLAPPAEGGFLPIRYWRRRATAGLPNGAVDFLPTSGSLISLAAWRRVGPFRADYFIGGIDVEWGYRCWASGLASVVADDIVMAHRWGHEGGGEPQILRQDDTRLYYYLRNAADGLRLSHMPARWKARQIATLAVQLPLLLASRRFSGRTIGLIRRALGDGWGGRLGRAPDDLDLPGANVAPRR